MANRTRARRGACDLAAIGFGDPRPCRRAFGATRRSSPAAGLIVNTTSLGHGRPAAARSSTSRRRATRVVADIVYVPLKTPLLAAAEARGLRTVDGLGMLLHQAVPASRAGSG